MIITRAAAKSMNPVFAWLIIDQTSVTLAWPPARCPPCSGESTRSRERAGSGSYKGAAEVPARRRDRKGDCCRVTRSIRCEGGLMTTAEDTDAGWEGFAGE